MGWGLDASAHGREAPGFSPGRFTPFPSTLARVSAETGRRLQSSDQDGAGRTRPRSSVAKERFGFLGEQPDYASFCETLRKHGTKNGWVVAATTLLEIPETLRDYMGVELDPQVKDEGPGF